MSAASDRVARAFLATHMPLHKEIHVSILRNAIDDCIYQAAEEDFIRKALKDKILKSYTHAVLAKAKPHMLELVADAHVTRSA